MTFNENERVLFQGDSITDGNRDKTLTDPNHFIGHSFPYLISARLSYKYMDKTPEFFSRGVSSDDVFLMSDRWQKDCLDIAPTMVNILIGVNDATRFVEGGHPTCDEYESTMNALIETTKAAFPGVRFVLCEPFFFDIDSSQRSKAIAKDIVFRQEIVKRCAEKHNAIFVPLQKTLEFYAEKFNSKQKILLDGIHPSLFGHAIICEEWFKAVGV